MTNFENHDNPRRLGRLLIVEDSSADVRLTVAGLKRAYPQIEFDVADSPTEAGRYLATATYDAILCDHNLNGGTGIEVLETLQSFGRDIPFVVVTATLGDEAAVEYIKRGASDYVLKNNLVRLPSVLDRALHEKEQREERARLQAEILAAKEEWELTFNAVADPVVLFDTECRVKRANRAARELLMRGSPSIIRKSCHELLRGRLQPPVSCPLRSLFVTENSEGGDLGAATPQLVFDTSVTPVHDHEGSQVACVCVMRDITERKRSEDALRQSEAKFRRLADSNIIGVVIGDSCGIVKEANDAYLAMTGYTRDDLRLGKVRWDQMTPPEYAHLDAAADEMLKSEGIAPLWEKEYFRKDGTRVPVLVGVALLKGTQSDGIAFVLDLSSRKEAELELRLSESKYRNLFERANDAITIFEPKTEIILDANPSACQTYGFEKEELIGKSLKAFTKDVKRGQAAIRRILSTGSLKNYETVRFNKHGEPIEMLTSATVIEYEGRRAILSIGRDITERKRAERALRESEARLDEAQQLAQLGSWEQDIVTGQLRWSEECFRIFGVEPAEFTSTEDAFFTLVHPDDAVTVRNHFREAVQTGKRYELVHRIVRPDGAERFVREMGKVIREENGQVRIVGTVQDITERKKLEEQFQQAQKMEAVGQLAGGVAHDFNNILMVISGYTELLIDKAETESYLRHSLDEIKRASERAASLTRQLLAFSRQQTLEPRILNLNQVVDDLQKMLRRLIGEDIDFQTTLDPELQPVRADPGQVEQVLINLAVNARDAMPSGGALTISTRYAELDELYCSDHLGLRPGKYAILAVTDTGCGMDAQTQSHIFEPFFTTKEMGKGTGLGLATVYGIIKQSSGYIWVLSEPGQGTTFTIYLPIVDQPVDVDGPKEQEEHSCQARILLAEDDTRVRQLISDVLRCKGCFVVEAASGGEALKLLKEGAGPMDLLLTDVVMPGMSGPDLATRAQMICPALRTVFMSGYADRADKLRDLIGSKGAFLQKPFTARALIAKINEVVKRTPSAGPIEA